MADKGSRSVYTRNSHIKCAVVLIISQIPPRRLLSDEAFSALRAKFLLIDVANDGKITAHNLAIFYHKVCGHRLVHVD
jgi:hypothetical protein